MIATDAKVDRLIPLYAIGVFTSFTLCQAGMAKHHLTRKEPQWRTGLFVNSMGACCRSWSSSSPGHQVHPGRLGGHRPRAPSSCCCRSGSTASTTEEAAELRDDAAEAAGGPILRRHVVIVLIDQLDLAAARAIHYARTLTPDELRAVHFAIDMTTADRAAPTSGPTSAWPALPLDIIECPDRRLTRAAVEVAAEALLDGDTEVSVLLPRLEYERGWHRLLHDRTPDDRRGPGRRAPRQRDARPVPPHRRPPPAAHRRRRARPRRPPPGRRRRGGDPSARPTGPRAGSTNGGPAMIEFDDGDDALEAQLAALSGKPAPAEPGGGIEAARFRQHVVLEGRVKSLRVQPWSGVATLEATLADNTGAIQVVFLGRRTIAGLEAGKRIRVEGVVGQHRGRLALLNPLNSAAGPTADPPPHGARQQAVRTSRDGYVVPSQISVPRRRAERPSWRSRPLTRPPV